MKGSMRADSSGEMGRVSLHSEQSRLRSFWATTPITPSAIPDRVNPRPSNRNRAVVAFDESMVVDATVELPVQINGKVRSRITVAADAAQDDIIAAALADEKIAELVEGKNLIKKIVVPGRLVNLVVK